MLKYLIIIVATIIFLNSLTTHAQAQVYGNTLMRGLTSPQAYRPTAEMGFFNAYSAGMNKFAPQVTNVQPNPLSFSSRANLTPPSAPVQLPRGLSSSSLFGGYINNHLSTFSPSPALHQRQNSLTSFHLNRSPLSQNPASASKSPLGFSGAFPFDSLPLEPPPLNHYPQSSMFRPVLGSSISSWRVLNFSTPSSSNFINATTFAQKPTLVGQTSLTKQARVSQQELLQPMVSSLFKTASSPFSGLPAPRAVPTWR